MNSKQIRADTSRIHDIINNFVKEIENFKKEVTKELDGALTLVETVDWSGDEAKTFKNTMRESASKIKFSLTKTTPIEKKLKEKADHWAILLAKLKA